MDDDAAGTPLPAHKEMERAQEAVASAQRRAETPARQVPRLQGGLVGQQARDGVQAPAHQLEEQARVSEGPVAAGGLTIRPCRRQDLELIEAAIPSPGRSLFHARRFADQEARRMTYLVAWREAIPVGHVGVVWGDADEREIRDRLHGCPMLSALGVWPPRVRGRGIGTALVAAAESVVRERGSAWIGLGVAVDNHSAERLYRRLGYADWGYGTVQSGWTSVDDRGVESQHEERLRVLVKRL